MLNRKTIDLNDKTTIRIMGKTHCDESCDYKSADRCSKFNRLICCGHRCLECRDAEPKPEAETDK